MAEPMVRFTDGSGYEQYMGVWSRLVGERFLAWLGPREEARWLDIGCGNAAFTALVLDRAVPASVDGVDPSEAQLAYARARGDDARVRYQCGDAMALPFENASFDVAVMPLVLFFIPDPARGVAEAVRVVAPGGLVAAYSWDLPGGGSPYEVVHTVMHRVGAPVAEPPHPEVAALDALEALWRSAGLEEVQTVPITVERIFASFDDYWATVLKGPTVGPGLKGLHEHARADVKAQIRGLVTLDAAGRVIASGTANAVRGRAPDARRRDAAHDVAHRGDR